jgi:hypothetical protein
VIHERDERLPEAPGIDQPDRLVVHAELSPREDLEQLVEGPEASGQRDEGVGQFHHGGLALVHRLHHAQLGQPGMRDLALNERARDDSDHLTPRLECRVGRVAHQADARPAIDEPQTRARDGRTQLASRCRVSRAESGARTAEDADTARGWPF